MTYFLEISSDDILQKLYTTEYNLNSLEVELKQLNLSSVQKLESFFEANNFKGFVVNLKLDNQLGDLFEYEIFFSVKNTKELTKIKEIEDKKLSNLMLKRDLILQSLIKMKMSSEFNSRERFFKNYASIMDLNSNPILLMEFDPIDKPIEFFIVWSDSNGKKEKYF